MVEVIPPFDIAKTPIGRGVTLLEASAGTGKTFAITGIFLRLLLEQQVADLREILVVTFTRDATAELRSRLREGLQRAARVFGHPPDDPAVAHELDAQPYLGALRRAHPDGAAVLDRALRQFDEIGVFTIHGFCRRVLERQAFESGLPFRVQFVEDEREFLLRAAADFWRRRVAPAPVSVAACVVAAGTSPQTLLDSYREYRRFTQPVMVPEPLPWDAASSAVERAVDALRAFGSGLVEFLTATRFNVTKAWGADAAAQPAGKARALADVRAWLAGEEAGVGALLQFAAAPMSSRSNDDKARKASREAAAFAALAEAQTDFNRTLLASFCDEVQVAFRAEKERLGTLDLNDLLHHVRHHLQDPARGPGFRAAIQRQWQVALVDEFQDTDPVQWAIFSEVFAANGLFMIGDPKQAIYSFRGADVFAYLRARDTAVCRYTLEKNWRSHPDLIASLNTAWGRLADPFLHPDIHYHAVKAGRTDLPALEFDDGTEDDAPLQLWLFADGGSASLVEAVLREHLARECVRLLTHAHIGSERVRPGDIAILVRANRDASPIQDALRAVGIPSVIAKAGAVFDTAEAAELSILLLAVASPGHTDRVRAALGTGLVGHTAADLAADDEAMWDQFTATLDATRTRWATQGATPALESLLRALGTRDRLLGLDDGLRRLTNLEQLLEFVHRRAQEADDAPDAVTQWFLRTVAQRDLDPEDMEMRPESDADAVRILTIHRAKGLEYPIVFAPFLHRRQQKASGAFAVHEGQRVLFDTSAEKESERKTRRWVEDLGENMRLAYVATTRAVHRLYTALPATGTAHDSAAAWLWLGTDRSAAAGDPTADQKRARDAIKKTLVTLRPDDIGELPGVGVVALDPAPPTAPWHDAHRDARWATARPDPTVRPPWSIESFSSMTRVGAGRHALPEDERLLTDADTGTGVGRGIHGFARGPRPGTCLHAILEQVDLSRCDQAAVQAQKPLVESLLRVHGFHHARHHPGCADPTATVLAMLATLARSPWPGGGGARFGDVTPALRLDEWSFHLPLASVRPRTLAARFAASDDPVEREVGAHLRGLSTFPVEGFLTGSVDAVALVDGRYWVVDWKSNYLGTSGADYHARALTESMLTHHYVLQGTLYHVALRRYLQQRLATDDVDGAQGGMLYVFLRGIDGEGGGLWHHRPSAGLVQALEDLFAQPHRAADAETGGAR